MANPLALNQTAEPSRLGTFSRGDAYAHHRHAELKRQDARAKFDRVCGSQRYGAFGQVGLHFQIDFMEGSMVELWSYPVPMRLSTADPRATWFTRQT